jgi:hypothetical protein
MGMIVDIVYNRVRVCATWNQHCIQEESQTRHFRIFWSRSSPHKVTFLLPSKEPELNLDACNVKHGPQFEEGQGQKRETPELHWKEPWDHSPCARDQGKGSIKKKLSGWESNPGYLRLGRCFPSSWQASVLTVIRPKIGETGFLFHNINVKVSQVPPATALPRLE